MASCFEPISTREIRTGQRLRVDGIRGVVELLEAPEAEGREGPEGGPPTADRTDVAAG